MISASSSGATTQAIRAPGLGIIGIALSDNRRRQVNYFFRLQTLGLIAINPALLRNRRSPWGIGLSVRRYWPNGILRSSFIPQQSARSKATSIRCNLTTAIKAWWLQSK